MRREKKRKEENYESIVNTISTFQAPSFNKVQIKDQFGHL
jgi:hypothetical protein